MYTYKPTVSNLTCIYKLNMCKKFYLEDLNKAYKHSKNLFLKIRHQNNLFSIISGQELRKKFLILRTIN